MGFHFNPTVLSVFLSVSTCVNFFKQLPTVSQISIPSSFVSQISDPNAVSQIPKKSQNFSEKIWISQGDEYLFAHLLSTCKALAGSNAVAETSWHCSTLSVAMGFET